MVGSSGLNTQKGHAITSLTALKTFGYYYYYPYPKCGATVQAKLGALEKFGEMHQWSSRDHRTCNLLNLIRKVLYSEIPNPIRLL